MGCTPNSWREKIFMTTRQFYFSGLTGLALCISGAALASAGVASWGLFWVGAAITGISLGFRLREQ